MNQIINELKEIIKSISKIKYTKTTNKNTVQTHKYNLNLQEETYTKFIIDLDNITHYINELTNINEYYEDLINLYNTKKEIPTLAELKFDNHISLKSISLNKELTNKINTFYKEIEKIIKAIENYQTKKTEINNKIEKINKKKNSIKNNLKEEEKTIKIQLEEYQNQLNNTKFFNIFKKDYLKSEIDLLNEQLKEIKEKEKELEKDYKLNISKEESNLNKLKEMLN